jgi:hypothetical protein
LKVLLEDKKDIVSGLYISRLQHKELNLSYDFETKTWDYFDTPSYTNPYKVDWTGQDCCLVSKKVWSKISWDEFSVKEYGVGEDGYFFFQAKTKVKVSAWIDPNVAPLHINNDGSVVSVGSIPRFGLYVKCPNCDWNYSTGKVYRDIESKCPGCGTVFPVDPYWEERVYDYSAVEAGLPIRRITTT